MPTRKPLPALQEILLLLALSLLAGIGLDILFAVVFGIDRDSPWTTHAKVVLVIAGIVATGLLTMTGIVRLIRRWR